MQRPWGENALHVWHDQLTGQYSWRGVGKRKKYRNDLWRGQITQGTVGQCKAVDFYLEQVESLRRVLSTGVYMGEDRSSETSKEVDHNNPSREMTVAWTGAEQWR